MPTGVIRYIWRQADNHRARRRNIESIILHATEGHKAGDLDTLIHGGGRSVSVHWYVTQAGEIYHLVQDSDAAFHVGRTSAAKYSNDGSIGIEQENVGGFDWTIQQLQAAANLCAFLMQKHGKLEIAYHKDVAIPKGRKQDPQRFPRGIFDGYLAEAMKKTWSAEQAV